MAKKRSKIKRGTINLTDENLSDLYSIIYKVEKHNKRVEENENIIMKFKINGEEI